MFEFQYSLKFSKSLLEKSVNNTYKYIFRILFFQALLVFKQLYKMTHFNNKFLMKINSFALENFKSKSFFL